jgi:hypothetical protein
LGLPAKLFEAEFGSQAQPAPTAGGLPAEAFAPAEIWIVDGRLMAR